MSAPRLLALAGLYLLVAPALLGSSLGAHEGATVLGAPVEKRADGVYPTLTLDVHGENPGAVRDLFLAVGFDNRLNLTVWNNQPFWFNETLNVSLIEGAAEVTPALVEFRIPPRERHSEWIVVRPTDVGNVQVRVHPPDESGQDGAPPVRASFGAPSVPPVSIRFIDPPPGAFAAGGGGDPRRFGSTPMSAETGFVRIRPGESITPRLEVFNPLQVPVAPFTLRVTDRGQGTLGEVTVASLDGRESRVIDFPQWTPVDGRSPHGDSSQFELFPVALHSAAGAELRVNGASFRIENGAVTDFTPAAAIVEVRSGVVIDLIPPDQFHLGIPSRIRYNVTNYALVPIQGTLNLQVETPGNLDYGIQKPERYAIRVDAKPGETTSGVLDLTPRVTGTWAISAFYRPADGMFYANARTTFTLESPLSIVVDSSLGHESSLVFARIGEPMRLDVSLVTTEVIDNAALDIAVRQSENGFGITSKDEAGTYWPGVAETLLKATGTGSVGTLRPGGVLNSTIEVVARGSGHYSVLPFVLANGIAYTHQPQVHQEDEYRYMYDPGYGMVRFEVAVQSRYVAPPLSLAPLTVGLALFVGMWTLRTRFVR